MYNAIVAIVAFFDFQFRTASSLHDAEIWLSCQKIWPFMVATPVHFSLLQIKRKHSKTKFYLIILYLSALGITIISSIPEWYQTTPKLNTFGWHSVYTNNYISVLILVWAIIVAFFATALPYRAYKKEKKYIAKKQFKFIFIAFLLGYSIGIISGLIIPLAGFPIVELDKVGIMISNIVIAYAMVTIGLFKYTPKTVADSVIRSMPAALFVTDIKGTIQLVNNTTLDILKQTRSSIEGTDINKYLSETNATNTTKQTEDILKIDANNHIPVYKTSSILYDNGNTFQGLVTIVTDISHLKSTQKELKIAKDLAEESDKLKSVFLANISHEIRTPMNAILGFSQLIHHNEQISEKQQKFLNLINKNVNNLLHIIDDLVEISKLESSKTKIKRKPFQVEDLFKQLRTNFDNIAIENHKHNIKFVQRTIPQGHERIVSDKSVILKVLDKLIENSIKFTEEGTIELGYQVLEDTLALFYVKDSGVGIPKDKCKVIFEPFRQSEDSYTRKYGGTGVSLTIAHRYVSLLGGKIWVESEELTGTVFYFSVPIWAK